MAVKEKDGLLSEIKMKRAIILETGIGLKKYEFSPKEWRVLGVMYISKDVSVKEIWDKVIFDVGEATIMRAIRKFISIRWAKETTHHIRVQKMIRGLGGKIGSTNRKKLYDLTEKGEKAYETYSTKEDRNKLKF